MNRLRITADDLGLHRDLDRGIGECAAAGRLTAASLAVTGESVDGPAILKLKQGGLRIGIHLTFTQELWLTTGRSFTGWPHFAAAWWAQPARLREAVAREVRAQIERFQQVIGAPDHLDGHQHLHILPGLWPVVLAAVTEYKIPYVRMPAAPRCSLVRSSPGGWGLHLLARRCARRTGLGRPCLGIAHSGHNTRAVLERELRLARGRDLELVVHPGVSTEALRAKYGHWHYDWDEERALLLDPEFPRLLERHGFMVER